MIHYLSNKPTNKWVLLRYFTGNFFYPHLYFKINFAYLQPSDYRKMVEVLLRTATIHRRDLIQRIAIGICNMVVCQVMVIWYLWLCNHCSNLDTECNLNKLYFFIFKDSIRSRDGEGKINMIENRISQQIYKRLLTLVSNYDDNCIPGKKKIKHKKYWNINLSSQRQDSIKSRNIFFNLFPSCFIIS